MAGKRKLYDSASSEPFKLTRPSRALPVGIVFMLIALYYISKDKK